MASSFETQSKYLTEAGYPILLQVSIAKRIFKYPRKKRRAWSSGLLRLQSRCDPLYTHYFPQLQNSRPQG